MTEKEILFAFLAETLNLPSESVADLLYKKADDVLTDEILPGALDAIKNLDKERVAKLKPNTKEFFDNGYKKAQAEISAKFEKELKETFGLDSELTGSELLAEAHKVAAKVPAIEDDKVKVHPLFIKLEKDSRAAVEAAKAEGETALNNFKAEQQKTGRVQTAQSKAKEILLAMKPVLEDDAKIADRRIRYFLDEFGALEYETTESGELIPMKDGKRLETAHGHAIGFEALVKNIATESFKFQVQSAAGNGGNGNGAGGAAGAGGGYKVGQIPKNEKELGLALTSAPDLDAQNAILAAYEEANGEITV